MASRLALSLVIGGAVASSVGAAFNTVEGRIKKLEDKGNKAKVLKSTIGETIKLRDEWKRAHDVGAAGADKLLRKLDGNLEALRKQGVEVGRLGREYQRLGREAKAVDLQMKGHQQLQAGKSSLKSNIGQSVVATGMAAVPTMISANYQAVRRTAMARRWPTRPVTIRTSARPPPVRRLSCRRLNSPGVERWRIAYGQMTKLTTRNYAMLIQRAARFFYLQHHAFAGKVTGQTFGTATTGPAINLLRIEENLSAAWQRLSGTYVENLSWLDCAERYDRAHTFHYMDPPYWQTAGYGVDFPFENYERMADFMRRCKGKVMVSINDHPDIRRVFEGFHFESLDLRYCNTNQRLGKAEVSSELVIMNWEATELGRLF